MVKDAERFLTTVMPDAMGDGAFLNLFWTEVNPRTGKKQWPGRPFTNVARAVEQVDYLLKNKPNADIYVCMSLQRRYDEKVSAKGNRFRVALRSAEDAVALRSLFLDIDVKEGAYATEQDALAALAAFIKATGMPRPTAIVSSGSGGFHVHWALEEPLTKAEWQPLAFALAAAVRQHGLLADTQCTIDAARILRVPGTRNHKTDVPREVTLRSLKDRVPSKDIAAALEPYMGTFTAPATGPKLAVNDDLGAGLNAAKGPPIYVDDLTPHCAFIRRSLGTGGKDNDQPLWFLTASIASFLEEGRDALHAMSDKHPTYSKEDTDALFDRVVAKKERDNLGWTQCQKIAASGCKDCASCPLLVQGKSPLNFATPVIKPTKVEDTLPPMYVRGVDGLVKFRAVQDDGTQKLIPISHYPILDGQLSPSPWTLHLTTHNARGKRTTVDIPAEVIFGKETFNKYMGNLGFFHSESEYKGLKEFFVSWLKKLQQSKDGVVSNTPFGWSIVDGKYDGFAYGGRVWMKDGDRPSANASPQLMYQYGPQGDIEVWKRAMTIICEQDRPGLNALLSTAFAGPLMQFTGHGGLMISAYSPESGIGKSTTLKTALSVWGHPTLAMKGLSDTTNAVLGVMGLTQHFPMYWDEIKGREQTQKFCNIAFELSGGKEKARMNPDTSMRHQGTWKTILVSASNESVIDGITKAAGSTVAGLYRLFEFRIPGVQMLYDPAIQSLMGQLENNYGQAGLVYAKFLGREYARIEQEVQALQAEITAEVSAPSGERLWVAGVAIMLKGAEYANELGLAKINIESLRELLLEVFHNMRAELAKAPSDLTTQLGVSSVLAEFLASTRARNTMVTNRIHMGKGRPTPGSITIQCDPTRLQEVGVQIGKEDKMIRISSTFFTRWMSERNYARQTFLGQLEQTYGMRYTNGKLCGGTDWATAQERLIELDGNHAELAKLLED